jgi:predicted membrane metal-binding protein
MSAHEDLSRAHQIKGSSDRNFGFTFAVFFALVGSWPLVRHHPLRPWALGVSAVFLVITLARASLLQPLNWVWIRLGAVLNRIVSPLISALVFYLTVTPIAWIMRAAGKDPLRLRPDAGAASYWINREPPGPEPATMINQF